MPRPVLGKVAVGDRLLVIPARYGRSATEPVLAAVTKVGRVWVELAKVTDAYPTTWRLRLDTQDSASGYANRDRFLTPEQYAWEEQIRRVHAELFDAGIDLRDDSPWREEGRRLALAEFIRTYDQRHP